MKLLQTIGIHSPGDMGHSVGQRLRENGLRVIAHVADRSARTQALARKAGIEAAPSYEALVQESDVILSILVPAQAMAAADLVADAIAETGADVLYADCNAIAPQTARKGAARITDAGGRFVDASIIGGPPRGDYTHGVYTPRIYASGEEAEVLALLNDYGLNIIVMSDRVGDASALKMCFASLTKGSTALYAQLMTAAKALGIDETLKAEFAGSMPDRLRSIERGLPRVPVKARRFVGEMEEMAKMYESLGMMPNMLEGAAEMYRIIGRTPLADRVPEDDSPFPSLDEALAMFVAALPGER